MLSAGRSMNLDLMVESCTAFLQGEATDDGEGGFTFGEPEELTFACRVLQPSESAQLEEMFAEQLREPGVVVLGYPITVDLPATATVNLRGDMHDVTAVVPDSSFPFLRRAILKRQLPDEEESS